MRRYPELFIARWLSLKVSFECIRFERIFRPSFAGDQMECKFSSYLIVARAKTCVRFEVRFELTHSLGDKAGSGIITLKSNQYSNWVERAFTPLIYS